jgi:hypothetical protein
VFPQFLLQAKCRNNISITSEPLPLKHFPTVSSFIYCPTVLRCCKGRTAIHQQTGAGVPFDSPECPSLTATLKTAPDTDSHTVPAAACSSVQSPPGFCTNGRTNKWGTILGAAYFVNSFAHYGKKADWGCLGTGGRGEYRSR